MMDFSQVAAEFRKLKAQYDAGALTEADFKARLQDLMVQDEQGRWWMIGYETGQWYVHDGEKWVRGEPPVPQEKVAAEPAPPREVAPAPQTHTAALARPPAKPSVPRLWIGAGIVGLVVVIAVISQVAGQCQGTTTPVAPSSTAAPGAVVTTAAPSTSTHALTLAPSPAASLTSMPTPTNTATPSPTATASTTPSATSTPSPTATATMPSTPTMTSAPAFIVKGGSAINVRSGPGTVYPVIGALQPGETRPVTGRTAAGDWWQFDFNGQKGWVSSQVAETSSQISSIAVVLAPATPTPTSTVQYNQPKLSPNAIRPDNLIALRELVQFDSTSWVESVDFSPDETLLAWGGGEGIGIYDLRGKHIVTRWKAHDGQVHTVAFSPDGRTLYSAGVDSGGGKIKAWDVQTWSERFHQTAAPEGWGAGLSISSDGNLLGSSGGTGGMTIWKITGSSFEKLANYLGHISPPSFSADGKWIAYSDSAGRVYVVQTQTQQLFPLASAAKESSVPGGAFFPDSSILATSASDGIIRLWRVADRALLRTMEGHTGVVGPLAFSPDGSLLASGARDNTVRLWQSSTGALLRTLDSPSGYGQLVFSSSGSRLASAGGDRTVRVWGVQ